MKNGSFYNFRYSFLFLFLFLLAFSVSCSKALAAGIPATDPTAIGGSGAGLVHTPSAGPSGAATIPPASASAGGAGTAGGGGGGSSAGATETTGAPMSYALLEDVSAGLQAGTSYTLEQYISAAFDWFLTLIAIIAILLLIVYGIGYTAAGVSEAGKMSMKNHLTGVMYGAGIALGGWILLTFVNPQITGSSLKSVDDLRALMPRATRESDYTGLPDFESDDVKSRRVGYAIDEAPMSEQARAKFRELENNFCSGAGNCIRFSYIQSTGDPDEPMVRLTNTDKFREVFQSARYASRDAVINNGDFALMESNGEIYEVTYNKGNDDFRLRKR